MVNTVAPVPGSERVEVIDSIRGFAVFGILVVNVIFFFNPWFDPSLGVDSPGADHLVYFLTNTFFVSKFYTLFSFLFGLGMYIQYSRATERGRPFLPVYLRRLVVLALFGLAHATFLWVGDILFLYAIVGLLTVLFFRKSSPRSLLVWAIVLIILPILFIAVSAGMIEIARAAPAETGAYAEVQSSFARQQAEYARRTAKSIEVYRHGSWFSVTAYRWSQFFGLFFSSNLFMAPSVMGMFLLGLRAGKRRWFTDIEDNLPRFRRFLRWAAPLGLALNLFLGATGFELNRLGVEMITWMDVLHVAALGVGSVLLSLSYALGIVVLSRGARASRMVKPLAPVGRMALSNYIIHSIVMTTLAYGYGLGLYARIDLWTGFLLAVLLFSLQLPLSGWWLRRRRFGPLEWLWRAATYGKIPVWNIP